MKASISKSEIGGRVTAPPSKSYTIRGLVYAALARGQSSLVHPLGSDDTEATIRVLGQLGVPTRQRAKSWLVAGGGFHQPDGELYCGESAATLRFLTAVSSLVPGRCRLSAGPSLSRRPVRPLIDALRQLGVNCSCQGDFPPVTVEGRTLKGGLTALAGNISSQFVSALLFVSPLAEKGVTIRLTTPLESKPYVLMTLDAMQWFGVSVAFSPELDEFNILRQSYRPTRFRVEGDWSSASYFLALGALAGEVEVKNLSAQSLQADKVLVDFLKEMGASVTLSQKSVRVSQSSLRAIRADLSQCIDLLPTMAVLAAVANGTSQFTGIERARIKESDRVAAVCQGRERMGIRVAQQGDKLMITGGKPRGALIDSRNDHRIAMAFSLLGVVAGGTIIEPAECVSKTYPEFWEVLRSIGGEVKINGK